MPRNRHALGALLAIVALALGWRLFVSVRTDWSIDSDEAVIGRMALHIGQAREWPVWYYGQPYMGSLEAYAAALPVRFLGTTGVPLRLTALVFAGVFVAVSTVLARRILGTAGGVATGLYLALGPLVLVVWSLKLRGGYASLFALGALVLFLAHRIGRDGPTRKSAAGLGLLLGLGAWLNLLVLPFFLSALFHLSSRRRLFTRELVPAVVGFAVGSAPMWVANIVSGGATFEHLFGKGGSGGSGLGTTLTSHLPQLLGVIHPWETELATTWRLAALVLFGVSLAVFLFRERKNLLGAAIFSRGEISGSDLYAVHALAFLACAALTSFGEDTSSRYAGILYVAIAPVFGAGFAALWERGARSAAALLLAALLAFNVYTVLEHGAGEGDPGRAGAFKAFRGTVDLAPLYSRLEREGVDAVAVDRWTGPRVVYETDEGIVALPTRYPPDAERFRRTQTVAWGVFFRGKDATRMEPFLRRIEELGLGTRSFEESGYTFHVLEDAGLHPGEWRVTTDVSSARASNLCDRDPRSRFGARGGGVIEIDLGAETSLGGLSAHLGDGERPASIEIETSLDGARWRGVQKSAAPPEFLLLELPGRPARYVRITVRAAPRVSWSIGELFLFDTSR